MSAEHIEMTTGWTIFSFVSSVLLLLRFCFCCCYFWYHSFMFDLILILAPSRFLFPSSNSSYFQLNYWCQQHWKKYTHSPTYTCIQTYIQIMHSHTYYSQHHSSCSAIGKSIFIGERARNAYNTKKCSFSSLVHSHFPPAKFTVGL